MASLFCRVARSLAAIACSGCAHAPPPVAELGRSTKAPQVRGHHAPGLWGIPSFFEVGRAAQLVPGTASVDTTGWPGTLLHEAQRLPRAYLSSAVDNRSRVFVYPEPDASGVLRRYALRLPEPKISTTNGFVTAYWGRAPAFMNFALESARSFATFAPASNEDSSRVATLRALLEPTGINAQDSENVYELEASRASVLEHKGLVPGMPVSFDEFTIFDRDSTADDAEPTPIRAELQPLTLAVGLTPLRDSTWANRVSFESNGYRVVLATAVTGESYFLAAALPLRPSWTFAAASADLTLSATSASESRTAGPGSAIALLLPNATGGSLLSGLVRDPNEVPALIASAALALSRLGATRRALLAGSPLAFAAGAARDFVSSHRSQRDPRALTEYSYGDTTLPDNVTEFSSAIRYSSDAASAIRGLTSSYRAHHDPEILQAIAGIAESSLDALTASGATLSKRFDQMALVGEHAENTGRFDVFLDNGGAAVSINHRRLVLASGETRSPGATWGAFGATANGDRFSVDDARFAFALDPTSIPSAFRADQPTLSVSRLFTQTNGALRVRETALLRRGVPAVSVGYHLDNTGDEPAVVSEAHIVVGDFFDHGTGANESSQNRYGLSRVVDGVRSPIGFWMEGMKAPVWGDHFPSGTVDLSQQYQQEGARFLLVFGFDKAQIYCLTRPAQRVMLQNAGDGAGGQNGFVRLEVGYDLNTTIEPHGSYTLPEVLSYTIRAPLQSVDGDVIPDQLQELAPLWTNLVSGAATGFTSTAFETDSGQAALTYSWMLAANLLSEPGNELGAATGKSRFAELGGRLKQAALRAAQLELQTVTQLQNRRDLLPTYANGNDYGFHLATFDQAFRNTCDVRYRDAFLALADEIARPARGGGLQITDPHSPSYGGYLSTPQKSVEGVSRVGDQGVKLWALRIAYERTLDPRYLRSAELFMEHWVRVRPEDHLFTGTTRAFERYAPAGIGEERTPSGHYALLAGLKAWSDISPRARMLYANGLEQMTRRHGVHAVGISGPYQMIFRHEGIADFGSSSELGGLLLWAATLNPRALQGRFPSHCRDRDAGVEAR